jgi:hypothetical protein
MPPWWSDRLPVSPPALPRLSAVRWTAVAAVLTWGCMPAARRDPGSGGSPLSVNASRASRSGEGIATGPHLAAGNVRPRLAFMQVRQPLCACSRARIPHQDQHQRTSMNIAAGQTGRDDLTARVFQALCQDLSPAHHRWHIHRGSKDAPGSPGPACATSHARSATTSTQTRNDPHPALQPTSAVSSSSGPPGALAAPDRRWFAGDAWLWPWRRDRSGGHPCRVMRAPPSRRRIRASGG